MTAGYGGFGSLAGGLSPFVTGQMPQMQNSFNYQQQSYQPSYQPQYNPYQQYENSLGSYNPYQMQSPFSYQQPAPMPQRTSSGPSQAIVGRSSQMRGTPNVMRRAEGGITSLMDNVE